jgi:hypothetical protein
MRGTALLLLGVACGGGSNEKPGIQPEPTERSATWTLPAGWRDEVIPFPLGFAPSIQHTGIEVLRFPAGFFDPASPEYWSYAFIWRTTDPAVLDAQQLGDELTVYFRGLIAAVDDKQRVEDRDAIVATAVKEGDEPRFTLKAHVFDAFKTAAPVDLVGWAARRTCPRGALWVFVLAPAATAIRAQLDDLARAASCDISPDPPPAK